MVKRLAATLSLGLVYAAGTCPAQAKAQVQEAIVVTSPAMQGGVSMPRDFAPDGRNLSPPLAWENLPAGTQQIVVLSPL